MFDRLSRIALALCLATTSVAAEESVPFPADALPVGTLLLYRYDSGAVQVREIRENTEEGVTIATLSTSRGSPLQSVIKLDPQGRRLELLYPTGRQFAYEPHDCARVIGVCQYVITQQAGGRQERLSDSVFADGRLTTTVSDAEGVALTRSVATFDEEGMLTALDYENLRRPEGSFSMRLTAIVPPAAEE